MSKQIIEAQKGRVVLNLSELIFYKDLFWVLAYRDFRIRYAQTYLGLLWAIIQPLATLLIFTLVFGNTIKVDTQGVPYPLFALAGMCAWNYFSFVLTQAGTSIVGAQQMIQKIYFPRLVIPLSKALVGLVDFFIVLIFYFIMMIFFQVKLSSNIVFFPAFVFMNIITALAFGIWMSALSIRYRDFQIVIPFLVQFGVYATPIAYPVSMVSPKFQALFYLNPMTGIVEGFRWCLIGGQAPNNLCFISFALSVCLFISGVYYFKKTEKIMVDIL